MAIGVSGSETLDRKRKRLESLIMRLGLVMLGAALVVALRIGGRVSLAAVVVFLVVLMVVLILRSRLRKLDAKGGGRPAPTGKTALVLRERAELASVAAGCALVFFLGSAATAGGVGIAMVWGAVAAASAGVVYFLLLAVRSRMPEIVAEQLAAGVVFVAALAFEWLAVQREFGVETVVAAGFAAFASAFVVFLRARALVRRRR